jgi:hypothetical protein
LRWNSKLKLVHGAMANDRKNRRNSADACKSDIIWQGDDGTAAMWLMDGTNAAFVGAVGLVGFNPGPNWDIVI